jgi:hypothetical protein
MMSDTDRHTRREPDEIPFEYRARCCADAPHRAGQPHGHDAALYSYPLRDARLALISPRAGTRTEQA